ncbi:MAG: DUF3854 domain-containing protein [Chloroflexi bacterium]|nr:DUF3854 domain-containing protein [Chloroflexota bacterium]
MTGLPPLLRHHQLLLERSAISAEVATARQYCSIDVKKRLAAFGFAANQQRVPALLLPLWHVSGEQRGVQIRPDVPRTDPKNKRPVKYDTPAGQPLVIDVPPVIRPLVLDQSVPLFITEGVRKADSAASHGLACVSLQGVWCWTDRAGPLTDWDDIPLGGRSVYLAFDSDVTRNPKVAEALNRLTAFLGRRQARVQIIVLPEPEDGSKLGLDDFFGHGCSTDELLGLAVDELLLPPEPATLPVPYRATAQGLALEQTSGDSLKVTPLCNFTARIVADLARDDGVEIVRTFEVEAVLRGRTSRFSVPAESFGSLSWVPKQLGPVAIVLPGTMVKEHTRAAIQMLSGEIAERTIVTHLGWRNLGIAEKPRWTYFHAGGAIDHEGAVEGVEVELAQLLSNYRLGPVTPGPMLIEAIRASLALLTVAPMRITIPLLAVAARAVIGPADFGVFLAGRTGSGKSELAARIQQHFGPLMDRTHLPASWSSTANALEHLAFVGKDALLVIDDFLPVGGSTDQARLHAAADRLFRAQGNASGRSRLTSDGRLRPTRPPRGLVLATGEDIPRGQSLRARILVLELGAADVNWSAMTRAQDDGQAGRFVEALSGFVQWLAPRFATIQAELPERLAALRQRAHRGVHRRTPEIVANLQLGFTLFLDYALAATAISADLRAELEETAWKALGDAARAQAAHQDAADPVTRYLDLLAAAVIAGTAHLADLTSGEEPEGAEALGWRHRSLGVGDYAREEWQSQGALVGWVKGPHLYLHPENAYNAVQRHACAAGEPFSTSEAMLRNLLTDRGLLCTREAGAENRATIRVHVGSGVARRRVRVLHLALSSLPLGLDRQTGPTGPAGPEEPAPPLQFAPPQVQAASTGPENGTSGAPLPFPPVPSTGPSTKPPEVRARSETVPRNGAGPVGPDTTPIPIEAGLERELRALVTEIRAGGGLIRFDGTRVHYAPGGALTADQRDREQQRVERYHSALKAFFAMSGVA